ncbi:MAG: hypothetical protein KAJ58_00670 [Candidatus Pacebacteria bacterium]|nr:hypothetical protein [Candidatus Paceibacterota bacterium]
MIFIIGNSRDLVEPVVRHLHKISNEEVVIFKADLCLENEGVGFSFINKEIEVFSDIGISEYILNNVESVWFWKPVLPKVLREYSPHEESVFMYRQFLALWRSLASLLKEARWINDYYKMLEAEHKPFQLKVAQDMGFVIPDTLITSNPVRAKDFWKYCQEEMIVKTLTTSLHGNRIIFTNKVTVEFMNNIDRLVSSPVIFQKLIKKKFELRITVVDNNVFAAVVKSSSEIDWRRGLGEASVFELPRNIKQLCVDYVSMLGLRFGCIDMIITPNNEYCFLEINPNGQWKFIEERTKLPIGKAIASALISK